MNYLHRYHAGHSADVFKHIVLIELIQYLKKKDKPFCYIETHAGFAMYDLSSAESQATRAHLEGISRIWDKRKTLPQFQTYFDLIEQLDPKLKYYPGSTYFAYHLCRRQDKLMACDISPSAHQDLQTRLKHGVFMCEEGYQQLKAWLPPPIKRGLVFIDPPFEQREEFFELPKVLYAAIKRWATGIFCVWYPIKDYGTVKTFYEDMKKKIGLPMLASEFCPLPCDVAQRLNGSGMLIVNPPWQLEVVLNEKLASLLPHLALSPKAYTRTFFL